MKRENEDWEVEELEEMEPEEQEDGWEADADGQTGQGPLKTSTMILVFFGAGGVGRDHMRYSVGHYPQGQRQ